MTQGFLGATKQIRNMHVPKLTLQVSGFGWRGHSTKGVHRVTVPGRFGVCSPGKFEPEGVFFGSD